MNAVIFPVLQILAALFLVALNGLFVTAEFAFTRLRETRVEAMVAEGRAWANIVREGASNLDTLLAVCQVGITISSLGLGDRHDGRRLVHGRLCKRRQPELIRPLRE